VKLPRGLRFDSGVEAGSEISLYYDSLLAKAIAHGIDRPAALSRLSAGLSELAILGVPTTQAFLRDAVSHPLFRDGGATTRFIETAFPAGWKPDETQLATLRAAACVAWASPRAGEVDRTWTNPWDQRSALRVTSAVGPARLSLHLSDEYGETDAEVRVSRDTIVVELDSLQVAFAAPSPEGEIRLVVPDAAGSFLIRRRDGAVHAARNGLTLAATVRPKIEMSLAPGQIEHSSNAIVAPLHGVVSKLYRAVGDTIEKGSPVLQMEAMKLIHTLNAPVQGRIAAIRCTIGETVPADALLVEIAPTDAQETI
jgi:3-methylcrotonyl-CoA carboxylase alpha subunit/geranyl-CoA carboxylase alpha subunit